MAKFFDIDFAQMQTVRYTYRESYYGTEGQICKQANRLPDLQNRQSAGRQTGSQPDREADKHTNRHRQIQKTDTRSNRQIDSPHYITIYTLLDT